MLDAEDLPDAIVVLASRGQPAEHAHQGEARDAGDVRRVLPHPGLVDQRLADVERDARLQPSGHPLEVGGASSP